MSVLTTIPRRTAALQYKALRLPYTVLEKQVVGRLLPADNPLRVQYERLLGSVDERAGRLTGDQALTDRGAALQRRAQVLETRRTVLEKAERLEAKAQSRKQDAEQTLQAEKHSAEQERLDAQRAKQEGVLEAVSQEAAEKRRVHDDADAAERAEKERIERQAEGRKQSVAERAKSEQERIAAEERAATAAPEAQIEDAVELAQAADQRRARADRMGELADAEAQSRRAERDTSAEA